MALHPASPRASWLRPRYSGRLSLSLCALLLALFPGKANTYHRVQDRALALDGVDDYVEILDHSALTPGDGFTIEAWVHLSKTAEDFERPGEEWATILTKIRPDGEYWVAVDSAGSISVRLSGGAFFGRSQRQISSEAWQHVAVTWDGTTVLAYINGRPETLGTFGDSISNSPANLLIGASLDQWPPSHHFRGLLDDVRIWARPLEAVAIRSGMHTPPEAGTIGNWRMEEGTGERLRNHDTGQLDGTIHGHPTWAEAGVSIQASATIGGGVLLESAGPGHRTSDSNLENPGEVAGIRVPLLTPVRLTALAQPGWTFDHWVGVESTWGEHRIEFVAESATTVSAVFVRVN